MNTSQGGLTDMSAKTKAQPATFQTINRRFFGQSSQKRAYCLMLWDQTSLYQYVSQRMKHKAYVVPLAEK